MKSLVFGGLGLAPGANVQLDFQRDGDSNSVATTAVKTRAGETENLPLYTNKDTVEGQVRVANVPGKKVEHQGVRVQLLGQIELAAERGYQHDFVALARDLAPPGELIAPQTFRFHFANVEMQYDSYRGLQVRVRYVLRVTVARHYGASIVKDFPFWVRNHEAPSEEAEQPPIKARRPPFACALYVPAQELLRIDIPGVQMEVGIEDCLHIEFEYDKSRYHLRDTVVGKIYFLLVRIKLKHMEVEIRRRETTGTGSLMKNESETLAKYEIMDGAPVRGENIPIRLFLAPYELTPTYRSVHNKFSVKYYLNLVLVDEEDRRYFKQQEIVLFRLPGAGPASAWDARPPQGVARAPARLQDRPEPAAPPEPGPEAEKGKEQAVASEP